MSAEKRARELLAALTKIRDSTFRDAASLRGIADLAINSDRAGDYALTPQWAEISTAPRDGSMFLGWVSAERHSTIDGHGSGISADTSEVDFCWWRSCQDIEEGGFYDNAMGQIGDFQLITHWMPMPTPPLPAPPEGEV